MRSNFVKGSGRHKKSFSPKQNGNYKPSYFRSIQKNKPKVPMRQKQDVVNTDVCHDESYPEVLLSDRRCYDNALRVQIGNVRAVTLVDSGESLVFHMIYSPKFSPIDFNTCLVISVKSMELETLFKKFLPKYGFNFELLQTNFSTAFIPSTINIH